MVLICRHTVVTEMAWGGLLHVLDIELEHGSQFGPQGHGDTIVVEVEHGDPVTLLH